MTAVRRSITLALVTALLALPASAMALDDAEETATAETDRAVTDRPTDRETDRPDLREIKARALATIDQQLAVLGELRGAIGSARHITEDHAAQLLRDISSAADGLTELARKIEAATTAEELRGLIEHIDDYKIGQVLAPKTKQVIGSDTSVAAARKLEGASESLATVIARFEEAGYDVDEAWRLLDSMKANTAEGLRLGAPVAGSVIGLQGSDWPDPAEALLAQGRADLTAARSALEAAHADAHGIVAFLRTLHDRATTDAVTDSAETDG